MKSSIYFYFVAETGLMSDLSFNIFIKHIHTSNSIKLLLMIIELNYLLKHLNN